MTSLSLLDLSKELSIQTNLARDIINKSYAIVDKEINEKSRNNSFVLLSPLSAAPQTPSSPLSPSTANMTVTDTSIDSTASVMSPNDSYCMSLESFDKSAYRESIIKVSSSEQPNVENNVPKSVNNDDLPVTSTTTVSEDETVFVVDSVVMKLPVTSKINLIGKKAILTYLSFISNLVHNSVCKLF